MSNSWKTASQPLWAVAVDSKTTTTTQDRGQFVCRSLQEMGCSAILVEDGDEAGLNADILLFMENLADFGIYRSKLAKRSGRRPITAVWMLETLPPSSLTVAAERTGVAASAWHYRLGLLLPKSRLSSLQKLLALRNQRQWLFKQISGIGYRRAFRQMLQDDPSLEGTLWMQIRGALHNWESLQRSRREGWLDCCIVSTQQRQRFLEERGWTAPFVPMGYYPDNGRLLNLERDLDVVFIGHLRNDRRKPLLKRLHGDLETRRIRMEIVTGNCFGEERIRLLNRAKIVVMLHQYSWSPAWTRFIYASTCGACVVSEPMADNQPFKPGFHYAAATVPEMPALMETLLKDDMERNRLANAARELCQCSLTLRRSVQQFRDLVMRSTSSARVKSGTP